MLKSVEVATECCEMGRWSKARVEVAFPPDLPPLEFIPGCEPKEAIPEEASGWIEFLSTGSVCLFKMLFSFFKMFSFMVFALIELLVWIGCCCLRFCRGKGKAQAFHCFFIAFERDAQNPYVFYGF